MSLTASLLRVHAPASPPNASTRQAISPKYTSLTRSFTYATASPLVNPSTRSTIAVCVNGASAFLSSTYSTPKSTRYSSRLLVSNTNSNAASSLSSASANAKMLPKVISNTSPTMSLTASLLRVHAPASPPNASTRQAISPKYTSLTRSFTYATASPLVKPSTRSTIAICVNGAIAFLSSTYSTPKSTR